MIPLLGLLLAILASPFKSKRQLEAENVALRRLCAENLIRVDELGELPDLRR
jgi:hypothetical protein